MKEEKIIKVWCRGSKTNPQGVLRALKDAGLHENEDKFWHDILLEAMSNPHYIFRSMNDAYGRPNYIGYHDEKELETSCIIQGLEPGWKQVVPSKKENWIDLNRKWREMGNNPMFSTCKTYLELFIWNGKHGGECQLQHRLMNYNDFELAKTVKTFKYWAYVKDFLPNAEDI